MHSRLLVSGLPRSLSPLPPSPAPPCRPCVEGRFREDLPVLRLQSDRGGEFSSDLLRDFCRGEGILQSFTLPASPQQNGVAERCIGLVMEVARTSMIHAAAPHFLWPFAVWYAVHQLNLWHRVSLPETSPTLCWTEKVGDASVFRFYHPNSRRVLPSSAEPASAEPWGAEPKGAEPGGAESHGAESGGTEPEGAGPGGTEPEGAEPGGAESKGAESVGAEPRGTASARGPAGASPRLSLRREPLSPQQVREWFAQRTRIRSGTAGAGGNAAGGTGAGDAGRRGARTSGTGGAGAGAVGGARAGDPGVGGTGARDPGAGGAGAGGTGAGGAGASSPRGAGVTAGAGGTRGAGAAGPRGARTRRTRAAGAGGVGGAEAGDPGAGGNGAGPGGAGARGAGAGGTGVGGAGAGGTGAGDPGAGVAGTGGAGGCGPCAGGTVKRRPFFVPLQLSTLPPPDSVLCQTPHCLLLPLKLSRQTLLQSVMSLSLVLSHLFALFALVVVFLVCVLLLSLALRPSSVPLRFPLLSPPVSSLPDVPDPRSDLACAASPIVPRLLATIFTDPLFESTASSALAAKLVDFAAACRLDYATSLVAEFVSDCPPSIGGECALGTDVLEERQKEFDCLAAAVPHLTAMDVEMASWKPTHTYVDAFPPSWEHIVDGMWIFRVKRSPNSPPVFKARYIARGFSQRPGDDFFLTFSPTPKMTTLRILLHVAAQRDYELHSLDFSTDFLQGSLHEEIWLRRPLGFTGSFPAGTQWSLRRPVYGLRQAPRERHGTLRKTLAALGFTPSTADPSLFQRTDVSLPPFYVLVYVDDLGFATTDIEALALVKSKLQKRHTCTDLVELHSYLGLQITRDNARRTITLTQSHMVHQVLQRFGFRYSSPQSIPLPTDHSLLAPPSDESVERSGPYLELVSCLMYLMTCTRPELAYPLSILARYVVPGRHRPEHWETAKRVLCYLCSASGMGLVLGGRGPVVLIGHADASWVGDLAT
ncbi:unnamed protein product [Closterium sp. NIES-54]